MRSQPSARGLPLPRRAITLIECLVLMAIVAVLVALGLPAIQRAREAARRLSCGNHLKQLGLAITHYHDTNGVMPPNRDVRWGVDILAYVEQDALHRDYCKDLEPWDPPNRGVVSQDLPVFRCPSSSTCAHPEGFGVTNYRANAEVLQRRMLTNIPDGTTQTALLAEGENTSEAVRAWGLGPAFHTLVPDASGHRRVCWIATASGSVHLIREDTSPEVLAGLVTPAGSEALVLD